LQKEAENTKKEFQIFLDGSALKGKVGMAAILIYKGRHTYSALKNWSSVLNLLIVLAIP